MIANYFKRYLSTRKVAYYIACGVALLALIGGIVAAATLKEAGISALAWVLPLLGLLAFIVTSLLGYDRSGICIVGVMSFFAFVTTVIEVFGYFLTEIQNQAMVGFDIMAIKGLPALIASAVLLVVAAIAGNVLAYLRLASCRPLELVGELFSKRTVNAEPDPESVSEEKPKDERIEDEKHSDGEKRSKKEKRSEKEDKDDDEE